MLPFPIQGSKSGVSNWPSKESNLARWTALENIIEGINFWSFTASLVQILILV